MDFEKQYCNYLEICIYTNCLKKTLWKLNRLSCIMNLTKQFNFCIWRKNSYLALQWYSLSRNDEELATKLPVGIKFFHRWELHGK
jgi:hypothetical protein